MLKLFGTPLKTIPLRVDSGDIILVNSSEIKFATIKLATNSRWHHVGMVTKYPGFKQLRFFEATSNGVGSYYLNSRLDEYLETDICAIRRLSIERTDEMREKLCNFTKEMDGKPYNYNIFQLVKARIGTNIEDNPNSF